jgi:Aspartyl protease/PDZ domain
LSCELIQANAERDGVSITQSAANLGRTADESRPKYGISAVFRFVISPVLVLLSSTFAICQATPRDFHFGSAGQTTVALSEESVFEATINGKGPFKLFFDTGANFNILNPEVIAQAGLAPGGDQADIHGINGGKLEVKPYRADEFRIGGLTLTGQTFYNVPMPLPEIVGAVGYELMSRLIIRADNEHRRLTFYDPARFVYNGGGEKLELLPNSLALIVHARVGKAVGDFVLDTGATGNIGIMLNHWFAQRHQLPHHLFPLFHSSYHGVFSGGADGDSPPSILERINTVCLGSVCVPRLVAEFSDGDDKSQYAGRISNEILRRFTFTIDWQHRAIYLEKTSHWNEPDVYNQTGLLLNATDNGTALVVVTVYPHSPASKAHIKVGDRIVFIDKHPPEPNWYRDDPAFLQPAGTVVTLTIQRDNSFQQINFNLKDIL